MSKRCLVTGGCGFLGSHLAEDLLERGYAVNILDVASPRNPIPNVKYFKGDLTKREDVLPALQGCEMVFHCASPPPHLNNEQIFYNVNIVGTRNLLDLCAELGIFKFVLTSSASVVFEYKDNKNGDESLPYSKAADKYSKSKIDQEKLVLSYNNNKGVLTCAIRPHGIFGPRDPQLVPITAKMASQGKMKFIIGDGKNLVDFTYVRNVTHGHILAAENLTPTSPVCGKAYFITNEEPVYFWTFMGWICESLGYEKPHIKLPYMLLYLIASILLIISTILGKVGIKWEPNFLPQRIALAGTHHYYSSKRAARDFGYKPKYKMEEGFKTTIASFQDLKKKTK